MSVIDQLTNQANRLVTEAYLAAPVPVSTAPPGSAGFTTIMGWVLWGATILSVIAFIVCGGLFLFERGRGNNEATKAFGFACVGSVLIGSASAIATTFVG